MYNCTDVTLAVMVREKDNCTDVTLAVMVREKGFEPLNH